MFGLGVGEVIVIVVLALIVLGPQKLPDVARQLARFMGEMRRVTDEMRANFEEVVQPPPPSVNLSKFLSDSIAREAAMGDAAAKDAPTTPPGGADKPAEKPPESQS